MVLQDITRTCLSTAWVGGGGCSLFKDCKCRLFGRKLEPRPVNLIEGDVGGGREALGSECRAGPSVKDEIRRTTGAEERADGCLEKGLVLPEGWPHGATVSRGGAGAEQRVVLRLVRLVNGGFARDRPSMCEVL